MAGKCPKCEQAMLYVRCTETTIHAQGGNKWVGNAYTCPSCSTVLSVEIDPIAVKTDIINELFRRLRG